MIHLTSWEIPIAYIPQNDRNNYMRDIRDNFFFSTKKFARRRSNALIAINFEPVLYQASIAKYASRPLASKQRAVRCETITPLIRDRQTACKQYILLYIDGQLRPQLSKMDHAVHSSPMNVNVWKQRLVSLAVVDSFEASSRGGDIPLSIIEYG